MIDPTMLHHFAEATHRETLEQCARWRRGTAGQDFGEDAVTAGAPRSAQRTRFGQHMLRAILVSLGRAQRGVGG
jgi:hypothetical protein